MDHKHSRDKAERIIPSSRGKMSRPPWRWSTKAMAATAVALCALHLCLVMIVNATSSKIMFMETEGEGTPENHYVQDLLSPSLAKAETKTTTTTTTTTTRSFRNNLETTEAGIRQENSLSSSRNSTKNIRSGSNVSSSRIRSSSNASNTSSNNNINTTSNNSNTTSNNNSNSNTNSSTTNSSTTNSSTTNTNYTNTNNTNNNSSIDVVLTVFERNNLWRQLDMVQQQTKQPSEIFVVQSGDSFDVASIIQNFQTSTRIPIRHIHFHYDGPPKYHKRFYVAYSMSTAHYVSIWDDDLYVGKAWLETVVHFMQANNDTVMVGNNNPRVIRYLPDLDGAQGTGISYLKSPRLFSNKYNRALQHSHGYPYPYTAHPVDWPIQQYNLRRENLFYFFAEPVTLYSTGEDIQLGVAFQKNGITPYALIPSHDEMYVFNRANRISNLNLTAITSIAVDEMGACDSSASYLRDQQPRIWLICHVLRLGFQPLKCVNCHPSVVERCLQHMSEPSSSTISSSLSSNDNNERLNTSVRNMDEPPIFVLTMPSRMKAMKQAMENFTNVHFIPGIERKACRAEDMIAEKKVNWEAQNHSAKYPLFMSQVCVHLGHVRMLNEFLKYLRSIVPSNATKEEKYQYYGIFLEDDVLVPPDLVHTTMQINRAAPVDWEIINVGRCLANCEEDRTDVENNGNTFVLPGYSKPFHFSNQLELCRSGYLVHSRGLRNLINLSLPLETKPGDKKWHQAVSDGKVKGLSLVPRLISQNRKDLGSLAHNHQLQQTVFAEDQECRHKGKNEIRDSCPGMNDGEWHFCANENEMCSNCSVGSSIRFGCGDTWSPLPKEPAIKFVDGPIKCSREIFGDPLQSLGKICQCTSEKPKVVVTTYYGGNAGLEYRQATEPHLLQFTKKYQYGFQPFDGNNLQYAGIRTPTSIADHKWVKLQLLRYHLEAQKDPNTWIWWTDADVLVDSNAKHSIEELIDKFKNHSIILVRRRSVTSSCILVRASALGREFINDWDSWRQRSDNMGPYRRFGWVDQGVLNDMLFESDGKTIRKEWNWRKHIKIIDCICTDLSLTCENWFCEGLYPTNYHIENFAVHAAGCEKKLGSTKKCVDGLSDIASQRAIGEISNGEPIYALTPVPTAVEAARAARRYFRQTYSSKKMIIVTESHDRSSFIEALELWADHVKVVFVPDKNPTLGFLRQVGLESVPLGSLFVHWDDDDIRNPQLIRLQYNEMKPGVNAVTLNSQIIFDIHRNASIVAGPPKRGWHGITGTILCRRVGKMRYNTTLKRGEDSQFLAELLAEDSTQVHVFDNPPEIYIRFFYGHSHASKKSQSLYGRLSNLKRNEWNVPLEAHESIRAALRTVKHPVTEILDPNVDSSAMEKRRIGHAALDSWCVVLTATLVPHDDVNKNIQSNVKERTESYRESLLLWSNQTSFPNVIMVDNSDINNVEAVEEFDALRQEIKGLQGAPTTVQMVRVPLNNTRGNKGIGEKLSIFHALDDSDDYRVNTGGCRNVLKVSGRFMPPAGLKEALERCPPSTKIVIQRQRGRKQQPMESQLFGWPRHGEVEELYRRWNGEKNDIERYLFEIVKFVGKCDPELKIVLQDFSSCQDVCFVGPLALPKAVVRGGGGAVVQYL